MANHPFSQITTAESRSPTKERLGRDLSVLGNINYSYHEGLPNLAEALARRLLTPRGGLFYDRTYGFDVRTYLNEDDTPRTRFELTTQVDTELLKDPRVIDSETQVSDRGPGHIELTSSVEVTPGRFDLILRVSEMSPATWEVDYV